MESGFTFSIIKSNRTQPRKYLGKSPSPSPANSLVHVLIPSSFNCKGPTIVQSDISQYSTVYSTITSPQYIPNRILSATKSSKSIWGSTAVLEHWSRCSIPSKFGIIAPLPIKTIQTFSISFLLIFMNQFSLTVTSFNSVHSNRIHQSAEFPWTNYVKVKLSLPKSLSLTLRKVSQYISQFKKHLIPEW